MDGQASFEDLGCPVSPLNHGGKSLRNGDFETQVARQWENHKWLQQQWSLRRFGSEEQRAFCGSAIQEIQLSIY